jgi:hypothetical protein
MNSKHLITTFLLTIVLYTGLKADEGMWIPILIERNNIKLMQEKGFRLSAEDIYSVNKACMKDAVVQFGGGCTGEIISDKGLLITNHHCGYSQIQKHSTVQNDYLTNGFWAMSKEEELPNPGLSVTFLRSMEDVTNEVLKGVTDDMTVVEREKLIDQNINGITSSIKNEPGMSTVIVPFYMGHQYFLFRNETFRDVRLVGAPPSAIGKFGGETDNWIWPRHTGDFSVFRIYAGNDNKPADYAKENVPYKPVYHFPISLKGVRDGDFTMVFGYPGTTNEYVSSFHVDMIKNSFDPKMIEIRTKKIEIMEAAMASDPAIRIQYSAKKSGLANSWKKWIGESQGLGKMDVIKSKQEFESRITDWIDKDDVRKKKYGDILGEYRELYKKLSLYYLVNSYTGDVFFNNGAEAVGFARIMKQLADIYGPKYTKENEESVKKSISSSARSFFGNYNAATDRKLFIAVMKLYGENIDPEWQAPEYVKLRKKCGGDFESIAGKLYSGSVFCDQVKFEKFLKDFRASSVKKLNKDPFYLLSLSASDFLTANVRPMLVEINGKLRDLNRRYMLAQMEFDTNRTFYPDANSTLRVAYGNVMGYESRDAVDFKCFTTLKGIMEKDNPSIYDYDVPEKLRQLYRSGDFGRYAQDDDVHVCFIANNHTTGGNSGSPVINADGQLIGINFDRAWEGVASDLAFNPAQSRNISLDIRYALFIIDKFAGAGYLLEEMTLVSK